jgi:ketosteroid isomerase-like protein
MLLSLLVPACAKEVVVRPAPPPVDWRSLEPRPTAPVSIQVAADRGRAAAGTYLKALASPDFAELGAALDEWVHFRCAGSQDVRGREEVVRAHDAVFGAFSDRKFVTNRILRAGGSRMFEWTMTGARGADHEPVAVKGLTLLWITESGLISDVHLYFNEPVGQPAADEDANLQDGPPGPALAAPLQELEQQRTPEEDSNVAVLRAQLRALTDDNQAAYLATLESDVEVTHLENEPSRGFAPASAWFRAMHDSIAYLSASVENAWGIGPIVVVEYHLVGERRVRIGRVPEQQQLITIAVVDIVEMRQGKIARVWRYGDRMPPRGWGSGGPLPPVMVHALKG